VRGSESESPEIRGLDILFRKTYEEAEKGEALCLTGSLGFLEIAIREGSASERLKASVGDGIILTMVSET
jgi:S-adenosylmethionine hydrolase